MAVVYLKSETNAKGLTPIYTDFKNDPRIARIEARF